MFPETLPVEQSIFSVTDISLALKECVEQTFSYIRVKGEVTGLKKAPSGHLYFSLKDTDSVLSAIAWRGRSAETMQALTEGLEVICVGRLSTYPGRSNYQMIVEQAEPAGIGALLKLLNERKEKLAKEGLFDAARKKAIPFLPTVIGVITSPTGAVIQDIIHRITDRFGRHIILWPVLVQGEGAADQITAAINGMNAIPPEGIQTPAGLIPRPDVLIVARGGGSLEDLWCFNEENVVRAAAASQIPIISAVGHETDTTLIDYVADLRAPTPTGAAEKVVPVLRDLSVQFSATKAALVNALSHLITDYTAQLTQISGHFPNLLTVIENFMQRLDDLSERLTNSIYGILTVQTDKLGYTEKLLHSYSYTAILDRGFILATSPSGHLLESAQEALKNPIFSLAFKDGLLTVSPCTPKLKSAPKTKKSPDNQPGFFDEI